MEFSVEYSITKIFDSYSPNSSGICPDPWLISDPVIHFKVKAAFPD